jgi:hypothetical protein
MGAWGGWALAPDMTVGEGFPAPTPFGRLIIAARSKAGPIFLTSRKQDSARQKLLRGCASGFGGRRFFGRDSRDWRVFLQFRRIFADLPGSDDAAGAGIAPIAALTAA